MTSPTTVTMGQYLVSDSEKHPVDASLVDLQRLPVQHQTNSTANAIACFYSEVLREKILEVRTMDPYTAAAAMALCQMFIGKAVILLDATLDASFDTTTRFQRSYLELLDQGSAYIPELLCYYSLRSILHVSPSQLVSSNIDKQLEGLSYSLLAINYNLCTSQERIIASGAHLAMGYHQRKKPLTKAQRCGGGVSKDKLLSSRPKVLSPTDMQKYQNAFELDLQNAYYATRNMSNIEDKISYWEKMPLTAEKVGNRNDPSTGRKTWCMLCLLMANEEMRTFFTEEDLESLDKSHVLKDLRSLLRYKNLSTSRSWRAWSGQAHLRREKDGIYTLLWK